MLTASTYHSASAFFQTYRYADMRSGQHEAIVNKHASRPVPGLFALIVNETLQQATQRQGKAKNIQGVNTVAECV